MNNADTNDSDDIERLLPLEADAARQAIPSLRGYAYQIARTALAWLKLYDDEIIVIEGAEDFDRLSQSEGVVYQVKALSSRITLRSADVSEAIQNLWNHRRNNRDRKVQFRFLTTADPGVESGNPFGMPGLEFWNRAREEQVPADRDADAARIRDFLRTRRCFSADLVTFMNRASPAEVFNEIIAPLRFDTALDRIEQVEKEMKSRLVRLGEVYGVPPAEADRAIDSILAAVQRVATADERVLSRELLLRTFEQATMKTVPRSSMQHDRHTDNQERMRLSYAQSIDKWCLDEEAWDPKFTIEVVIGTAHSVMPLVRYVEAGKGQIREVPFATRVWLQLPSTSRRRSYDLPIVGANIQAGDEVAILVAFLTGSDSGGVVVGILNYSIFDGAFITLESAWKKLYQRREIVVIGVFGIIAVVSAGAALTPHPMVTYFGIACVLALLLIAFKRWTLKVGWPSIPEATARVRELIGKLDRDYQKWLESKQLSDDRAT